VKPHDLARTTNTAPIVAVAAVVLTVWSVLWINPYRYGASDHTVYIPIVKTLIDASLYPGDPVVATPNLRLSALWRLIAFLHGVGGVDLATVFLSLHLLSLVALCLAVYGLTRTLSGTTGAGLIAMAIAVVPKQMPAGVASLDDMLLTRGAALPFVIFAGVATLRENRVTAAALLSVAFWLHPLTAIYAGIAYGVGLAGVSRSRLLSWIPAGVLVIALCIPAVLMRDSVPVLNGESARAWMDLQWIRSRHHLFPSSWAPRQWLSLLACLGSLLLCGQSLRWTTGVRSVGMWCAAALGLLGVAFVCSQVVPVRTLIELQFGRSLVLVPFWTASVAAIVLARSVSDGRLGPSVRAFVGVGLLAVGSSNPALIVALALAGLAAWAMSKTGRIHAGPVTTILFAALLLSIAPLSAGHRPMPLFFDVDESAPWRAVQQWARKNTPIDALFVVPPFSSGFRSGSERSVWVEWKDGTVGIFDAAFGQEWIKRMTLLGVDLGRAPVRSGRERPLWDALARELRRQDGSSSRPVFIVLPDAEGLEAPPEWLLRYHHDGWRVFELAK
jgi:hypothetical protein